MTPPKVIVFDLGKVLVDFDYGIAARRIASRGKISPEQFRSFINQSPLFIQYESGTISSEQFYRAVAEATGFAGDFAEFSRCFADIFVAIPPMVELHAALRQRGLPAYVFSNTNELAVSHIRQSFPFYSQFDGYILSYEHGAMKPDAPLYEVVERRCGCHEAEILYLDDRPENIATGAARGWQVILQETPERTRSIIDQLGLLNHKKSPQASTQ